VRRMSAPVPPPPSGVRRSRDGAILGGVCAGIARAAGLDPLLLRVAVVVVTILTGGTGLLAYLAAWILIPREPAPAAGPGRALPGAATADLRGAWRTAGDDLRSLADNLRAQPAGTAAPSVAPAAGAPGADGEPAPAAEPDPAEPESATPAAAGMAPAGAPTAQDAGKARSPITAADDAATALGERLRAPEVKEGARRAANSVSQAVTASVDEVSRRVRRDKS
jgi:phage shock protein PspC (stress-responsive transcriptional regulator)